MIRQKTPINTLDRLPALRPIRTAADHEAASRTLRRIIGSRPETEFTADERDYLEVLTMLIRDYQHKQVRRQQAALGPAEIIRHLMQVNGLSVTDLGTIIGSRTAASMILHGRRSPSKVHILRLAERFNVDTCLFLARGTQSARETLPADRAAPRTTRRRRPRAAARVLGRLAAARP